MNVLIRDYVVTSRTATTLACVAIILAFTGGGSLMYMGIARAASPADQADCRRDKGIAVMAVGGTVVCVKKSAVVWEASRR